MFLGVEGSEEWEGEDCRSVGVKSPRAPLLLVRSIFDVSNGGKDGGLNCGVVGEQKSMKDCLSDSVVSGT